MLDRFLRIRCVSSLSIMGGVRVINDPFSRTGKFLLAGSLPAPRGSPDLSLPTCLRASTRSRSLRYVLALVQCLMYSQLSGEWKAFAIYIRDRRLTLEKCVALGLNGLLALGVNIVSFYANRKAGPVSMSVAGMYISPQIEQLSDKQNV